MEFGQVIVTLIAAILSSATTLVVCLINNNTQNNKQKAELDKIVSLLTYRLDELTKKVDQGAAINEKVTELKSSYLLLEEKMKDISKKLEKLEEL